MPWLQLSLTTDRQQAPAIEALFEGLGALSVTCDDAGDQPLLEPAPGEAPLWSRTRVTALFEAGRDADLLRAALANALPEAALRSLEQETLEDRPWERAWLDDFQPMRFGERLWVCPAGQRPPAVDAVVLDLDPGLAFGTGTHPTTSLCLQWLDRAELNGKRVLDFGCGSGILAIAAALLGAESVTAVDHDPQALEATRDNAAKNGVLERIDILPPDQAPNTEFDIVLANILAGTLVELAPQLQPRVTPGGQLLLSGILLEQAQALARKAGAELVPQVNLDADAARSWTNAEGQPSASSRYSAGVGASYELDLWGRLASGHDAARRDAAASAEELRSAAISLTAEVASTWYQLIEQRALAEILETQNTINQQALELITLQFSDSVDPFEYGIDLGQQADDLGIDLGDLKIAVDASLTGNLTIGIKATGTPELFIVPNGTLNMTVNANANLSTPATLNLGILEAELSGVLGYSANVQLQLTEPSSSSDNRIDLGDLGQPVSELVTVTFPVVVSPTAASSYLLNRASLDDGQGDLRTLETHTWVNAHVFLPLVYKRR